MAATSREMNLALLLLQVPLLLYILTGSHIRQQLTSIRSGCVASLRKLLCQARRRAPASMAVLLQREQLLARRIEMASLSTSIALLVMGASCLERVLKLPSDSREGSLQHNLIQFAWECLAATSLSVLRFKKVGGAALNVIYILLMLTLPCLVLPGLCPTKYMAVAVGLTWALRCFLLPLSDSAQLVLLANVVNHIAIRVTLSHAREVLYAEATESKFASKGDKKDGWLKEQLDGQTDPGPIFFLDGLEQFDLTITLVMLFVSFWLQEILDVNVSQRVQAAIFKNESEGASSLLGAICDAHVLLDASLRLERDEPALAAMLFGNPHNKGTDFTTCFATSSDRSRFLDAARRMQESSTAGVLHADLRDGIGNIIPAEVFHVRTTGIDDRVKHLVGVRERRDDVSPGVAPAAGIEAAESTVDLHIDTGRITTACPSSQSDSETSGESEPSQSSGPEDAWCLFNAEDFRVLSATPKLKKQLKHEFHGNSLFLDIVSHEDLADLSGCIAKQVESSLFSRELQQELKIRFRASTSHGRFITRWTINTQRQGDVVLARAILNKRAKPEESDRSGGRRSQRRRRSETHKSMFHPRPDIPSMEPVPEVVGQRLAAAPPPGDALAPSTRASI